MIRRSQISAQKIGKYSLLAISLILSILLLSGGFLQNMIDYFLPFEILSSFIAGIFFTSFFTAPVATVTFYILGEVGNPFIVAFIGGMGAVVGDLILVKIFRGILADIEEFNTIKNNGLIKKIGFIIKTAGWQSWLFPLVGGLIIASPFPDELGLLLISTSKMNYRQLALLSYSLNTTGILLITLTGRLIRS